MSAQIVAPRAQLLESRHLDRLLGRWWYCWHALARNVLRARPSAPIPISLLKGSLSAPIREEVCVCSLACCLPRLRASTRTRTCTRTHVRTQQSMRTRAHMNTHAYMRAWTDACTRDRTHARTHALADSRVDSTSFCSQCARATVTLYSDSVGIATGIGRLTSTSHRFTTQRLRLPQSSVISPHHQIQVLTVSQVSH